MPERYGYKIDGGWASGADNINGNSIPQQITADNRTDNTPAEYKASNFIEFVDGFVSGASDEFFAYIATASNIAAGNTIGSGGEFNVYRYGFNGKENDNEVKGEGNQQDYGMRIYDGRLGRFLSEDPITKKYPELTPYQFASNRPIEGIDLDGLEFMKYDDSYIRMAISYNNKGNMLTVVNSWRLGEKQKSEFLGFFAKLIVPYGLEQRIKGIPSSCNCIPTYDSRVTIGDYALPQKAIEPSKMQDSPDGGSSFTKTEKFQMVETPKEQKLPRFLKKLKNTPKSNPTTKLSEGLEKNVSANERKIVIVESVGKLLEMIGEYYFKSIINTATGEQSAYADKVAGILQKGIANGTIAENYKDPVSLSALGNYLLYGKEIEDQELLSVGKKLWNNYQKEKKEIDTKK